MGRFGSVEGSRCGVPGQARSGGGLGVGRLVGGWRGTCWRRGDGPAALLRRRCRGNGAGHGALSKSGAAECLARTLRGGGGACVVPGCAVVAGCGAEVAGRRWRCGVRARLLGCVGLFGGAAGCHDLPWVRKRLLGLVRRSSTPRRRRCCGPRRVGVGCCGESPSHAELRVTAMSHSCSSHGPPMSRSRHCRAMGVTPP